MMGERGKGEGGSGKGSRTGLVGVVVAVANGCGGERGEEAKHDGEARNNS